MGEVWGGQYACPPALLETKYGCGVRITRVIVLMLTQLEIMNEANRA